MNIWHKLSMKQKFLTVFVIYNISIIVFSFFIKVTEEEIYFFNFDFIIFFIGFYIGFVGETFKCTKNNFFIYCIFITLYWLLNHLSYITTDFNINYNELKYFSGEKTYYYSGKYPDFHIMLKKDKREMEFKCSLIYDDRCHNELIQYFGIKTGDHNGENFSVKYTEFSRFNIKLFVFSIRNENVIYEIKHNDKIIYSYDYFINKFSNQKKKILIFSVYLILNSVIFCIFYYWIQKDFVQHS